MRLNIYLINPDSCNGCPCSVGICGCNYYLNEFGHNSNCGCDEKGNPIRLEQCKKENGK